MSNLLLILFTGAITFFVAVLLFNLIRPFAHLIAVSVPNKRSVHLGLIPQVGGVIILSSIAVVVLLSDYQGFTPGRGPILLTCVILTTIGWLDDRFQLPVLVRLVGYAASIGGYLCSEIGTWTDISFVDWFELSIVSLIILTFINFTNFMDGMDGIIVFEFGPLLIFICALSALGRMSEESGVFAALVLGPLSAFLIYNRPPAGIFLGDAGSVLLGFLVAVLLWNLSNKIGTIPSLMMPLYFILDPGVTLIKRIYRRERFWEAHRQHYYQRALDAGQSNWSILARIGLCNLILCLLAYAAIGVNLFIGLCLLGGALCCVMALLSSLASERNA